MHQKHLLRFIKSKLRKEPDEVVIFRDGKYLTLKEVRDIGRGWWHVTPTRPQVIDVRAPLHCPLLFPLIHTITLQVFESLKMTGHDLNVDTLDMHADKSLFHRFDKV